MKNIVRIHYTKAFILGEAMKKPLLFSIAISLGAGLLSSLFTLNSREIYQELNKPPFSPPGWVFPIVWIILYILMGVAAYLIFKSVSPERKLALTLYLAQLIVNIIWPILFFRFNAYFLSFLWIVVLWYLVSLTTRLFFRINEKAGWLMVPYLLWVSFAVYLNLLVSIIN